MATHLAIKYAFSTLNLHKLFLIVDLTNKTAIDLYQKTGFKDERVLTQEVFVNGEYRDVIRMALFQSSFFKNI